MNITIVDCYTDEPAGLGVPPFIGTYPRYLYGYYSKENDVSYLTIDDLRAFVSGKELNPKEMKTNIKLYNRTRSTEEVKKIIENTKKMIIIAGVHTPGKYLSAVPGTLNEIEMLVKNLRCEKAITGPAVFGSAVEGGKIARSSNLEIEDNKFSYKQIKNIAIKGTELMEQIPYELIAEIETGKGCSRNPGCSFCTEPIKNCLEFRDKDDVVNEVSELHKKGIEHFRLGKQSCYYSYPKAIELMKDIRKECPSIKTLHIDNVNPAAVVTERGKKITRAIVEYGSPGNVASFGVESFDRKVIEANNLNSDPDTTYEAIKIINSIGGERSNNGMQNFLPGINLLFGLKEESKSTHKENMMWLKKIMDDNLLLRRINIRQVNIFEGTDLFNTVKNKFIRKNKSFYWKWRDEIRHEIDLPMLKRVLPEGTILKDVRSEIHDGKTTFMRQIGSYPLIVGVRERLEQAIKE